MEHTNEAILRYCEAHSTVPSPICEAIARFTEAKVERPMMLSGPLVGGLLGFLISATGAKRVLEIGTFTGYSALAMAERLPPDGEVVTLDVDPKNMELAKAFWEKSPHGSKIRPIVGRALESLETIPPGLDFVFIDADKTNYLNYLKRVLLLMRPGGIIAADNTLWSGHVLEKSPADAETKVLQQFNDWVHAQPNLETLLVPIRDGVHLLHVRP